MKTRWIITSLLAAALASCSSTPRGSTTTPAVGPNGNAVTTQNGTAVSERANNVFATAATEMRTHDSANDARGDWTPETCTSVAASFEQAANAQANGNFPEAWFNRGMVFYRCNQNDQARQSFQRALQAANNNFCRAKVQLGVMAYQANDTAAARTAFEEAIAADRTHCVEGYTNLAMLLRRANPTTDAEWQNVVRNIRAALALDDRYLPARNELALSYLQQAGDDPNSQRVFLAGLVCTQAVQVGTQNVNELAPDVRSFMADLYNTWGLVDIRRGEIIKALGHFQRASQLNPNMFEAHVNYGTINLSFRGYADARSAFERAIALRADSYDAHIGLGVAIRGLAQAASDTERPAMFTQAQQEYERARTLDAQRPDSHYNLALLHMSYTGGTIPELEQALRDFDAFRQRAGATPRFSRQVEQSNRNTRNINDTITALRAVGSTGPTPPATPPASGATPPAATPAPAPTPAPAAAPAPAAR